MAKKTNNYFKFVRNYSDLSTDQGFQYEFFCDQCGTGYRTKFKANPVSKVTGILSTANSIFGGILGGAVEVGERVKSVQWEQKNDEELEKASKEILPYFIQCPKCKAWVCRENCWNERKGLCKNCAPDIGVEMSAAQASKSREEIWAHAKMSEEDKKLTGENWRANIRASCPQCESPLAKNAKFCPECGYKLQQDNVCPKCQAKTSLKAKFCPECGEKLNK